MYTATWGDISEQSKRYSLPTLMDARVKDAEMLRHNSPLHSVSEIKIPLLMVHGGLDRRVPVVHADRFRAAARAGGVAIERVDYAEEGHGFFHAHNAADYLRRLKRFLAQSMPR